MKRLGLALMTVLAGATAVMAAGFTMPTQYSTTMVNSSGGQTTSIRYCVDGQKTRSESNMAGQPSISIVRPDKQVTYAVIVAQKMYIETAIPPNQPRAGEASFVKVGTEHVDGHFCAKMRATVNGKVRGFYWVDQKTHYPVKFTSADGQSSTEYQDFKTGPQPASLFEPPAGFKKMTVAGH